MRNPFTAPDVNELDRDKLRAEQRAVLLLFSGAVFVVFLLLGYYAGIHYGLIPRFGEETSRETPLEEAEVSLSGEQEVVMSVEDRLREISGSSTPMSEEELELRGAELAPFDAEETEQIPVMSHEDRLRELQ